jgi:hypothetical protein
MLGTYFAKFDEIVYMEMEVQFVCDMPVNFNWYKFSMVYTWMA